MSTQTNKHKSKNKSKKKIVCQPSVAKKQLVIQYDGITNSHFLYDLTGKPIIADTYKNRMNTRLLEDHGCFVVRVSYDRWRAQLTEQQRFEFLIEEMVSAGCPKSTVRQFRRNHSDSSAATQSHVAKLRSP